MDYSVSRKYYDLYHLSVSFTWMNVCYMCRYLTGNPCTEYEGYWEYVIATLPQLQVVVLCLRRFQSVFVVPVNCKKMMLIVNALMLI